MERLIRELPAGKRISPGARRDKIPAGRRKHKKRARANHSTAARRALTDLCDRRSAA